MKIILLKDIAKMGKRGEVKEAADGYAINVLIAKGLAVQATPGEMAKWKQKEDAKKFHKEIETNTFVQLVDALRKQKIVISGKKHDDKGQLFAQVKEGDIVDAIFSVTKLSVDAKQIHLASPIKHIGVHAVTIAQGERKETFSIEVA